VVPPNLGAARDHLRENRTVLLVGPRGCGLSTAAKMLLKELINETTPYAELADEAELLDERLADSTVHPGHRLILDLTESKEEVLRRRLRDLPSFHAALQKNDAFLAVVVPEARAHQIDSDLNRHIVRLDRPRGLLVLRRHLEAAGIFLPDHHLITKDLSALLTGPMREIEDLARDVISERAKAPDDEPATWLSRAVSAEADRSTRGSNDNSPGKRTSSCSWTSPIRGGSPTTACGRSRSPRTRWCAPNW
jgi:energy-coupling factor transporter ATP-binding protein EcfA2